MLLLDEIGDLPLGVQAKLLRVLELGEVYRVGSLEPRRVDVQVLAATNRDLRSEVVSGRFRSDLFYRLNIVEVRIPALRERREDVPHLARAFVGECAARLSKPLIDVTEEAGALLVEAPWDGNVRELRNVIERACLLADGPLLTEADIATCLPHESYRPTVAAEPPRGAPGAGVGRASRAAAPRDGRARPHPARAAARARQQEGRGAPARGQPPRPLPPPRAAGPREHDHPPATRTWPSLPADPDTPPATRGWA